MKTNTLDIDTQALRHRILDLAMQGKLVKQNPSDEPASVLLNKIKAEKTELVKKKKIKKSKPLPEINDGEKPFVIPENWEWVRLAWVIALTSGRDLPKSQHLTNNSVPDSIPYITGASNINDNTGKITINEWTTDTSTVASAGDILISVKGTVGKITQLRLKKAYIARQIMAISHTRSLSNDYLVSYLRWYVTKLRSKARSMIPGISRNDILSSPIPFPPLSEQKRIAAKIDQLFNLIQKIETAAQQYDELKTALKSKVLDLAMQGKLVKQDSNDEPASELLKQIEDAKAQLIKEKKIKKSKPLPEITDDKKPFDIPNSWEWVRLGNIFTVKGGKRVPKGMTLSDEQTPGSKVYLRVADMKNNSIDTSNLKYADEEILKKIKEYTISTNDLYFSIAGSIGKAGIIPQELDGAQLTENAAKLVPVLPNNVFQKYSLYLLESNCVVNQCNEIISRVAQPKLALIKVKNLLLPLPPLSEQKRIASKIEEIFAAL